MPQPKTSRDLPPSPKTDDGREQQQATIKDADKTDQADRNRVHGDGSDLGLDKR